jgi:hypothetical protein
VKNTGQKHAARSLYALSGVAYDLRVVRILVMRHSTYQLAGKRYALSAGLLALCLFVLTLVAIKNHRIRLHGDVWSQAEAHLDAQQVAGRSLAPASPERVADLLVDAIIQIESRGNPRMTGAAGERGLMQIMPGTWTDMTARHYGHALPFDYAFDPAINEQVGRVYLAYLQERLQQARTQWRSDERALLLAAYNGGLGRLAEVGYDVRRMPASVRDYVQRGTNLHDYFLADSAPLLRYLLSRRSGAAASDFAL